MNNTNKYNNMQDDYSKYRPDYPNAAIECILNKCSISNDFKIADIGAGTGKLALPFLKKGYKVYCVEPNKDMYRKCASNLGEYENFYGLLSTAENTGLEDQSINLIVIGQAFHWFNLEKFKKECKRILTKDGYVVILYNDQDYTKEMINELHKASQQYCPNYKGLDGVLNNNETIYNEFFTDYNMSVFNNNRKLNLEQFIGGCFTASFALKPSEPNYENYLKKLKDVFTHYSKDGYVIMPINTTLRIGKI